MTLSSVLDEKHSELLSAIMKKLGFRQKQALQEAIESLGLKLNIIQNRDSFIRDGLRKGITT